jgi:hypothetical protein
MKRRLLLLYVIRRMVEPEAGRIAAADLFRAAY